MKNNKRSFWLFLGALFIIFASVYGSENDANMCKNQESSSFIDFVHLRVQDAIEHSQDIPGLKREELIALRQDIVDSWDSLVRDGVIEVSGTDREVRPIFVAIQGAVEHVLSSSLQKEVKVLKGIIHTPMPATPLCTKGEVSKELVDPSLEIEPASLYTVKARTTIIRDYLTKGGMLYNVYPKNGFKARTQEQQQIYVEELSNYSKTLCDVPIACESIPEELVGATYLFQDEHGDVFVFAIKMTQAKNPKMNGNFGIWFGSICNTDIQKRVQDVIGFLENSAAKIDI
ncbi:MAG: hypothetical protein P4L16_07325 [Chlamydiales bacterium]|nr:hypothetical protein [Chlamydiales bacterium]